MLVIRIKYGQIAISIKLLKKKKSPIQDSYSNSRNVINEISKRKKYETVNNISGVLYLRHFHCDAIYLSKTSLETKKEMLSLYVLSNILNDKECWATEANALKRYTCFCRRMQTIHQIVGATRKIFLRKIETWKKVFLFFFFKGNRDVEDFFEKNRNYLIRQK